MCIQQLFNFQPRTENQGYRTLIMQTAFFRIIEYLKYWGRSKNVHRIHSPFMFHLFYHVILNRGAFKTELAALKRTAAKHEDNSTQIKRAGIGALNTHSIQSYGAIARRTGQTLFWREALYRIAANVKPDVILELGTGSGITALYLAEGSKKPLFTIEGDTAMYAMAQSLFGSNHINITSIKGMFDEVLPDLLPKFSGKIMAYIDGNHTYEATKRYFEMIKPYIQEDSLVILDDIYWSPGMLKAWNEIKKDNLVQQSADFYRLGMLFFRKQQAREHFTLRTSTFGIPYR